MKEQPSSLHYQELVDMLRTDDMDPGANSIRTEPALERRAPVLQRSIPSPQFKVCQLDLQSLGCRGVG